MRTLWRNMKLLKDKKQYFVILYQNELEMKASQAQRLVYASIKSFTANGKLPCEQSYLSISKRAGVSDVWVKKAIESLIKAGWIQKLGEVGKRGGSCPILKVQTDLGLNNSESSNSVNPSSNSVSLSSNSLGTKDTQSNKEIKNLKLNNVHAEENKVAAVEYADDIFNDNNWHKYEGGAL